MRLPLRLPATALLLALATPGAGACRGGVDPPSAAPPDAGASPATADAARSGPEASRPDAPAEPDAARSDRAAEVPPDAPPSGAEVGTPAGGAALVFDPRMLHRIEIQVDSQHLAQLEMDQVNRVPCTVVYDGTVLARSGIRKKGGPGSLRPLADKPAFSIKFNQFVPGQKLLGLSKLLLNNAVQDGSFLSEHMAYEMVRRAGGAAPLTAHGLVTLNQRPLGLYVVREAFNGDFIERSFGKANQGGNFYEGGEFVGSPTSPELKDEKEEMRSRAALVRTSEIIRTTPDPQWVAAVEARLDLGSFFTGWAIEALVDHWDGYFFGPHNHYLYQHPGNDRLVFLVAGMDDIFSRIRDPRDSTKVLLAEKVLSFPDTRARLRTRLLEIVRGFDLPAMLARIDQAARTIRGHTPTDGPTRKDFASFDSSLAEVRGDMASIRAWTVPVF
jgi:spore coat protein H